MEAHRKGLLLWEVLGLFLLTSVFAGASGDVPDDVVYTDLHKTVKLGDSAVLKCQFRGTPLAVYWKKGDDPGTAPNLVSWIPGDPVTGLCEGERPCKIMEMNEDFSLIIKEVSMEEQGRYICRVASYKGILIHNFTEVNLFSPPQNPVPVIDQCAVMEPSAPQSCSISTSSPINITCLASRYYPDLDLFFLHGRNKTTDQVITEWTNHDGTKNKSISIKGSPSETPYVCVAWDIPGAEDQRVATVLLRSPRVSPSVTTMTSEVTTETVVVSRSSPFKIIVPIIIIALAGGTFLIAYCWLKRRSSVAGSGEGNVEETQAMHVEGAPASSEGNVEEAQAIRVEEKPLISFSFKRSVLRRWLWQGLFQPHDVIYHKGKYFITDTGHHCVSSYNPATEAHTRECRVLPSYLYGLTSLSDPDRGILVTDFLGGHVYRIDNSGRYDKWASGFNKPSGIATLKGKVFVAEFDTNRIKVYDEKGNHLRNFDSHLKQPWFLAVNSEDRLYVADSEAIKVFTTAGEYKESFKISNDGNWFNRGIAIDCYDNVFVTARDGRDLDATETLAVFNSKHRCVKQISVDCDFMHYVRGLCINHDRNELAVVDGEWHRLKLFELYKS